MSEKFNLTDPLVILGKIKRETLKHHDYLMKEKIIIDAKIESNKGFLEMIEAFIENTEKLKEATSSKNEH